VGDECGGGLQPGDRFRGEGVSRRLTADVRGRRSEVGCPVSRERYTCNREPFSTANVSNTANGTAGVSYGSRPLGESGRMSRSAASGIPLRLRRSALPGPSRSRSQAFALLLRRLPTPVARSLTPLALWNYGFFSSRPLGESGFE
jgi:hypothetical protein